MGVKHAAQLYADLPSEERLEILKGTADNITKPATYEVKLTPQMISQRRESYMDDATLLDVVKAERKAVMDEYKAKMSEIESRMKETMKAARMGRETRNGSLYEMYEINENQVYQYNEEGALVNQYPMRPDQKQLRIKPHNN
jgi:hypothetical protein